jgi:hypothetical protein
MPALIPPYLRIIGNCVDGLNGEYVKLIDNCEFSLQLGNLGYSYQMLQYVDYHRHRIMGGSLDNYHLIYSYPHCLPDYGIYSIPNINFFYLRGGYNNNSKKSNDYQDSYNNNLYSPEELTYLQLKNALALYMENKPNIVLTYDCPYSIGERIFPSNAGSKPLKKSKTNEMLDQCLQYHAPKLWIFASMSQNWKITQQNNLSVNFISLGVNKYVDIAKDNAINTNKYSKVYVGGETQFNYKTF